jgi:flagellar hook-basal body complex protein FliE
MSMEFLAPIAQLPPVAPLDAPPVTPSGAATGVLPTGGFATTVTQGLQQVDRGLQASQADLRSLAAGDVSNLHQVMVRLEESRLSMQLVLQVRNRLLESYQEMMRMQV